MVIGPGVEVKAIEGDALLADRDFSEKWAHFGVEAVSVHAEIERRVPEPDQPRLKPRRRICSHRQGIVGSSTSGIHGGGFPGTCRSR
jgi:hypothetical protein